MSVSETQQKIEQTCNELRELIQGKWDADPEAVRDCCSRLSEMLKSKNRAYGNSALQPVRIFSKADSDEQLLVRIDDKLNRIQQGSEFPGDDTLWDLAGYIVLLLISRKEGV